MRLFAAAMVLALTGCATYVDSRKAAPEVVYQAGQAPALQIIRQSTANRYKVVTPEGLRTVNRSFDHHYMLMQPDGTTTALSFLDMVDDPSDGKGVISAVFDAGGNDRWVALSEQFKERSLDYASDRGFSDNGRPHPQLTAKVFVKTFSRSALLHEAVLDVCNPSNADNPPVRFDDASAVIRYCDRTGTQLYFPLTGARKQESAVPCCHDSASARHRRERGDYYQRTSG